MPKKIVFQSLGFKIVSLLFFPDNYEKEKKYPALVFDGPMTGLKDQVVAVYAEKLAHKGYICLTFDHRFYGESGGEPRQLESPKDKIEDIKSAVTYLLSRPDVDGEQLSGVGVCAGGGYMGAAAAADKRIKNFASIAGCFQDPSMMKGWMGEAGYNATIERSRRAEENYRINGKVDYIPAVSSEPRDMNAAMPGEEPFAYYGTQRGYSPNYVNRFAVMGYERFLTFDAQSSARGIAVPTIIVHGTKDLYCSVDGAQRFYDNLDIEKKLVWINTRNHIDLYDQDEYVDQAVDQVAEWFALRKLADILK